MGPERVTLTPDSVFAKVTEPVRTIALGLGDYSAGRGRTATPRLHRRVSRIGHSDRARGPHRPGDGLNGSFTGLITVAGTQALAAPVAPASNLDNIRSTRAQSRLRLCSTPPTRRTSTCCKRTTRPQFRRFRPLRCRCCSSVGKSGRETVALASGTALVGDFSKAVLFDRQSLNVPLGTINDQCVRSMITSSRRSVGAMDQRALRPCGQECLRRWLVDCPVALGQ